VERSKVDHWNHATLVSSPDMMSSLATFRPSQETLSETKNTIIPTGVVSSSAVTDGNGDVIFYTSLKKPKLELSDIPRSTPATEPSQEFDSEIKIAVLELEVGLGEVRESPPAGAVTALVFGEIYAQVTSQVSRVWQDSTRPPDYGCIQHPSPGHPEMWPGKAESWMCLACPSLGPRIHWTRVSIKRHLDQCHSMSIEEYEMNYMQANEVME
jgi:hypothetical protein